MSETPQEADRAPGAPHPRETPRLFGQDAAERDFLDAFNAERLHHGWLISGPRGVGKATLAWRIARFLLATPIADAGGGLFGAEAAPAPAQSLDIDPAHPVNARINALSEPRLFLLRRPWDDKTERLRAEITVDEVRRLRGFFEMSAADGGRRVVIVDAADDLNVNAANALLKLLEEPPRDAVLLMIAHQPSRLLPTIISRCRTLRCRSLEPAELDAALSQAGIAPENPEALAALAAGSAGAAFGLIAQGGLETYAEIVATIDSGDRQRALKLAESATGRPNAERFGLILDLFDLFLARLARAGVAGPPAPEAARGEAALMARLCPGPAAARGWAQLQQELGARARHGRAVNLDPASLILDIVLKIHQTAAQTAA